MSVIKNIFGSKEGESASSSIADFKDPFNKECVYQIFFFIRRDKYTHGGIEYNSVVYFENGNTKGEQKVYGENFVDLVKKTEDFVKSL